MSGRRVRLSGRFWRIFHLCAAIAWALMGIPTVLWWHHSILWVGIMSVYACMGNHWSSFQAARVEEKADSVDL